MLFFIQILKTRKVSQFVQANKVKLQFNNNCAKLKKNTKSAIIAAITDRKVMKRKDKVCIFRYR